MRGKCGGIDDVSSWTSAIEGFCLGDGTGVGKYGSVRQGVVACAITSIAWVDCCVGIRKLDEEATAYAGTGTEGENHKTS